VNGTLKETIIELTIYIDLLFLIMIIIINAFSNTIYIRNYVKKSLFIFNICLILLYYFLFFKSYYGFMVLLKKDIIKTSFIKNINK